MAKKQVAIRPIADRILVKPTAAEEKSASGIIIPETVSKEKPERGTVIAIGEGKRAEDGTVHPLTIKVGDEIVFSKYGYDEIKVDNEEYYIVREDNVLAVIG